VSYPPTLTAYNEFCVVSTEDLFAWISPKISRTSFPAVTGGGAWHPKAGVRTEPGAGYTPGRRGRIEAPPRTCRSHVAAPPPRHPEFYADLFIALRMMSLALSGASCKDLVKTDALCVGRVIVTGAENLLANVGVIKKESKKLFLFAGVPWCFPDSYS
jgi:hypothetical protein